MNFQLSTVYKTTPNTATLLANQRRSDRLLYITIFVAVTSLIPLLVLSGATFGFNATIGLLLALAITVSIVRWPIVGLYVILGCTLLIEQGPLVVNGVGFYF